MEGGLYDVGNWILANRLALNGEKNRISFICKQKNGTSGSRLRAHLFKVISGLGTFFNRELDCILKTPYMVPDWNANKVSSVSILLSKDMRLDSQYKTF